MRSRLLTAARAIAQRTTLGDSLPFQLLKRIEIPITANSPSGLLEANAIDPFEKAGKYGLWWTYFSLTLMGVVVFVRIWHWWQDKIRQAIWKQQMEEQYKTFYSNGTEVIPTATMQTEVGGQNLFPEHEEKDFKPKAHFSSVTYINDTLALFRYFFYRPIPDLKIGKRRFTLSSLAVLTIVFIATLFVCLVCFLLQPLYWQSIQYGSPPVAIRAGMVAVAMTPWILATSTKANILTIITGIGPERLNVFHRWAGYICLLLALIHTIPFYVQPVWDDGGMKVFSRLFPGGSGIIYGTGIACLVPLIWLCIASLPIIRRVAYEIFVILHVPVGVIYLGLLFWHTKNFLASWSYLWVTVGIWVFCLILRFFNLNWTNPRKRSFLVGDEAAITLMTENAVKITIPTQMRWRPGQYIYLRMPGISVFENHPFTISSLCSDDFPSEYGESFRDCVLVFKPYGGFTRKVLETAIEKGPFHTYRAFLDGPYGGMRRELAAFDTCILIAGGSGITALISQLLNLIKRMRDGKAITKRVVVVWSVKRLEAMDWFREELRICRESAPPEAVTCKFFVTATVRPQKMGLGQRAPRPISNLFHDKLDGFVAGIASKRNSALITAEAAGDPDRERELRAENEDRITALPQPKHLQPYQPAVSACGIYSPQLSEQLPANVHSDSNVPDRQTAMEDSLRMLEGQDRNNDTKEFHFPTLTHQNTLHFNHSPQNSQISGQLNFSMGLESEVQSSHIREASEDSELPIRAPELAHLHTQDLDRQARPTSTFGPPSGFEFGFPATPTEFQKAMMRFAFPVPHQIDGGWSVEYGRPDLGYMLKEWATGGPNGRGILGRRTAVFVCGPPSMREGVANTVARLQAEIWGDPQLEEIFLHTENYAL